MSKVFPSPVTLKQVVRRAVADWFGKEVQTGYTVTYVWMANQFGHFGLGFLFTFLVVWGLMAAFRPFDPVGWLLLVPIGHAGFWSAKEIRDYRIAIEVPAYFPVHKGAIAGDAATAVLFICFGIAVAYTSLFGPGWPFLAFLVSLVLAAYPAWYWLRQKMTFQQAGLPFQYRLGSFPGHFANDEPKYTIRDHVLKFIDLEGPWQHVLIIGPLRAGKTSLAAGIGTEHTFALGTARYTSWFKLLQLAQQPGFRPVEEGRVLWGWRTANILIVDDVDPGTGTGDPVTPDSFKRAFFALPEESQNAIRTRRTVWVLGRGEDVETWVNTTAEVLKCEAKSIGVLELIRTLGQFNPKTRRENDPAKHPVGYPGREA